MNDGGETTVPMLPDDLLLNLLARVSRFYYPILSLVSKRFRSVLASTELYQTRTVLGRTESCLYACLKLRSFNDSNKILYHWFILCQRPNCSRKVLVPISSPDSTCASSSGVAVVGHNIYAIGGGSKNIYGIGRGSKYINASSSVMVMDCSSHTWSEAPSMRVARVFPSVCTLDGKIYVTGGCDNIDSTNWMEVFDTKTQTWEFLQIPSEEICIGSEYESMRYEGTVHVSSEDKSASYKLHKGRWRATDILMNMGWWLSESCNCVIGNVFYRGTHDGRGGRSFCWYEPKDRIWKDLKGLEGLTLSSRYPVKLADHGGKMAILWQEVGDTNKTIFWHAEIALERRQNQEIWGTLVWLDNVFTSSQPYGLVHAFSTTV